LAYFGSELAPESGCGTGAVARGLGRHWLPWELVLPDEIEMTSSLSLEDDEEFSGIS